VPKGESVGTETGTTISSDAVELLFAALESVLVDVTVAVFEMEVVGARPDAVRATRVMVGVAPGATVPRVQVTVVVPLQLPVEGVADTNVRLAGRTSVTVTPLAVLGPALPTVMV